MNLIRNLWKAIDELYPDKYLAHVQAFRDGIITQSEYHLLNEFLFAEKDREAARRNALALAWSNS